MTPPRRARLAAAAVGLALAACGRADAPAAGDDPPAAAEPAEPDEVRVIDDGRIHRSIAFIRAPDPGVKVVAVDGLSLPPDATAADAAARRLELGSRVATSLDPAPHLDGEVDSLVFTGHLVVPEEGLVTFTVDGPRDVRFTVHRAELVTGPRGRAAIGLAAGYHPFELAWILPDDGAPRLDVTWSGPGIDAGPIPPEALVR